MDVYSKSRCLDSEPAFIWWVPFVLKKQDTSIADITSRNQKSGTHNYGIEVPNSVPDAYQLDKENGVIYWKKDVAKETNTILIAFDILDDTKNIPSRYNEV